nr:MAG: ORF1 [TTV-like mini virus]
MYYWRNYRARRYNRRRRYWRRRPRRFISRRFWRRKKYRVRKRKLKKIRLTQYQPHFIRKLTVKGDYPLFITTSQRLSNNLICTLESTAPHDWPGGGGFSIANFTLEMLYKENLIANNYWTTTNDNMPLIRYFGCKITLFTQPEVDYLFYYNNSPPMVANKLTYMSTQPQVMLQLKHIHVIKCRHTNRKKPYKRIFVPPPTQMMNKWYLQHDIATVPLLQTLATVCSLDRKYLHANAKSTTMGFMTLNTEEFQNHYFGQQGTGGYQPKHGVRLFGVTNVPANATSVTQFKIGDLTYLGQTYDNSEGTPINEINSTLTDSFPTKIEKMMTTPGLQGNPFHKTWLHPDSVVVKTSLTTVELKNNYSTNKNLEAKDWAIIQTTMECRYNPFKDKGVDNKVYLVKVTSQLHADTWDPPHEIDLVWQDLPLYILTWGYLDFQRKCGIQQQIDVNSCLVIQSKYIEPTLTTKTYIPLDTKFEHGLSPYADTLYPSDHFNWHPKVRYQVDSVNLIASVGPNTVKLPDNISCEAHIRYKFKFKIGGEPAPMNILVDPQNQPAHTFPNNLLQTTSLQSPTTPIEHFLWRFDERRGLLTKKATERIKSHPETEKTILSITDPATTVPIWTQKEIQTEDTSTSEEEETSLESQLLHERRKQKLLRQRINKLLNKLAILE